MSDPILNSPSPKGDDAITSFGEPIPFAPGEEQSAVPSSPPVPALSQPEEEPFRPSVEWFEELLWKEASDDMRVYCIMDGYWAKALYGRLLVRFRAFDCSSRSDFAPLMVD